MNRIKMEFDAISENEGLARVCVAAFAARLDPTLEEINDIKTAVSEAVTNSVIHGYDEKGGRIIMEAAIEGRELEVIITDYGKGIENVERALEPFYTTGSEKERSGMGFTFMEVFMDELEVRSEPDKGTVVKMKKRIGETVL
ncbi:MAG: anti-sigma F factor [Butyrivibrio sp.]|nr:anti-sigma F factor [Butyrivibrio sp.]